ncbi:IS701 family transposase [Streptomyces johnsoniae]|uniref:Transposase n=1 Tax=Streptomyces johnsoniae TaxID=3075532 RepID=A0ABU2SEG9_9ACTN|nr:transposase [Streptomyces sp. DSM 41886]MDT0446495.1 transposase [Streptomyces sp. DSM 41886]
MTSPQAPPREPSAPGLPAGLGSRLFTSLPRAGQRLKAEQYVRGLLALRGRKTLRNISDCIGGDATLQNVHHFISVSPWDWRPVRQALARQVRSLLGHEAWVVRPTVIPKAGRHSIGVDQQYVPHLGEIINGQQAVGAWVASERAAVPVDWRLVLPRRWTEGPVRQRASIPAEARGGSPEECIRELVTDPHGVVAPAPRPLVVDAEGADAVALAHQLAGRGQAFIVRAGRDTRLRIDASVLPAYGERLRSAEELIATLTRLRRPVRTEGGHTIAAAVPVVAPQLPSGPRDLGAGPHGLLLVGEWSVEARSDVRLWLTNAGGQSLPSVLRLTRLSDVVQRDFDRISERVGVRDFTGRSYPGWHHHVTLASVAHFAAVLADTDRLLADEAVAWCRAQDSGDENIPTGR